MEATYVGIHMWAQAVEKAKSTDTDKVIAAMAGQTFKAPSASPKMDEKNHHLHKPVFIGEIKADGQFNVVWKTKGPIRPSRGARSSRATKARRTSPRRSAGEGFRARPAFFQLLWADPAGRAHARCPCADQCPSLSGPGPTCKVPMRRSSPWRCSACAPPAPAPISTPRR
jgi:hypothetical protein